MPEFLVEDRGPGQVQVYLGYTTAPAQVTYVRVINRSAFTAKGSITRNNGQKTAFTIPPNTQPPGTTINVNPAQYTCTVDAQGQLDVAPNYDMEWPT
jgi:hypothetical protein